MSLFILNFALMSGSVFILQFNGEPLFPSKNITVLWHVMYNRCSADRMHLPLPYATVRRRLVTHGEYIHEPRPGWTYRIIERQLLKKPVQHKIGFIEETLSKQS